MATTNAANTEDAEKNVGKLLHSTKLSAVDKMLYPKKVTSLKKRPVKSTNNNALLKKIAAANVTAAFKDLPADDLEFIKELDKQFKLHGGKIKIKVEKDNSTESAAGKNSKRTIDGDLG